MAVGAAVQIAEFLGTVIAGPHGLAQARLRLEIKVAVSAAPWQALKRLLVHLTAVGALPSLLADTSALGAESVTGARGMGAVYLLAKLALVASDAVALAIGAVSVAIAIGHFALVVAQRALLALPAGIALALAVYVLAALAAQHRAHALATVLAAEAWVTLTVAEQTLALAAAAVRAVVRHILGDHCNEAYLLGIAVVVVEREEPVARLHVVRHLLLYRRLLQVCEPISLQIHPLHLYY